MFKIVANHLELSWKIGSENLNEFFGNEFSFLFMRFTEKVL